ncbi:MAG: radical SAM protein [Chloroflexi bacterium]|nr:radical SAM protein [Chloroflexota bacterium]
MSVEGPDVEPRETNLYHQILAQTQGQHRLFSVLWELTYRCNQSCSHCYLDVLPCHAGVSGELTTAECLRVLDELAELGVLNLTLSGGEIFARRDFFEIAEYARARRFLLRLFTNGALVDAHTADRIAALHPYAVELSVYSAGADRHDEITRSRHSFEHTIGTLRLLRERGVRTVMKTPLMRENIHEFHTLQELARDLGAQFRYATTITPKDDGDLSPLRHKLTYDDLLWLFEQTLDPKDWVGRAVPTDSCRCSVGQNALSIDPYGNVFPCVQVRERAGNVRADSLRRIWEEWPAWEKLAQLTWANLFVCRSCDLRPLCARCHGLASLEHGDLRRPAHANCQEALARRQVLVEKGALPPDYPIPSHLRSMGANASSGHHTASTAPVWIHSRNTSAPSVGRRS